MERPYKKKLIEVALPLEQISRESAKERTVRHGHPSNIHLWWSRKPLATARAILFSTLVDDPSSNPDKFPDETSQRAERERLFDLIEELIKIDNAGNGEVFDKARLEVQKSCDGVSPVIVDPFCGGGSIPLEAIRLGAGAFAADLNPVAVMITKGLIELPRRFLDKNSVNPSQLKLQGVTSVTTCSGLLADIRYYADWIRTQAESKLRQLYPTAQLGPQTGGTAQIIAWIWARVVECPNPACKLSMPLVNKFWLSSKKGKETWVEPIVQTGKRKLRFEIKTGAGTVKPGTINRRGAICFACKTSVAFDYIRQAGREGKIDSQLMAIVADGAKGRIYLPPDEKHAETALSALPDDVPDTPLPDQALGFRIQSYGMTTHASLFTKRQLVTLTTLSKLIEEARKLVIADALKSGWTDDKISLNDGGTAATAYGDCIAVYLSFLLSKQADLCNALNRWEPVAQCPRQLFGRQVISMVWEYAESNPLGSSSGSWKVLVDNLLRSMQSPLFSLAGREMGTCIQNDATNMQALPAGKAAIVCTDPPYYDNIGYADLSDFFYVWLRKTIGSRFPDLFKTVLVPKDQELVANPFRFSGDRSKAQSFFQEGLMKAFQRIREIQHPDYPVVVFYAFKQSENDSGDEDADDVEGEVTARSSTGWETMLEGLISSGFEINGTWPIRTEMNSRMRGQSSNALASSIVLVCRPRVETAPSASRREFLQRLKQALPDALAKLRQGNIPPTDLAQAAIGPGIGIYSSYTRISEANGQPMSVKAALQLINQMLDEVLSEQDSDYDADTRWAISWFEQYGFTEGPFGTAEVLSKAKDTALGGLVEAGIVESKGGKVRLYKRQDLASDWDPLTDKRLTVWEITHYLIRALEEGGKASAAALMNKVGNKAETAQELAYRLYGICERKKWAQEALAYNSLVVSWPEIKSSGARLTPAPKQLLTSEI